MRRLDSLLYTARATRFLIMETTLDRPRHRVNGTPEGRSGGGAPPSTSRAASALGRLALVVVTVSITYLVALLSCLAFWCLVATVIGYIARRLAATAQRAQYALATVWALAIPAIVPALLSTYFVVAGALTAIGFTDPASTPTRTTVTALASSAALLVALAEGAFVRWWAGISRRIRRGACYACGYDLTGSTQSPRCPECGAPRYTAPKLRHR